MIATIIAFIIGIVVAAVIIGIVFVYDALAWGLVLQLFWAWFLMPVFPELQELLFLHAVGLMFFISLFKNYNMPAIKKQYKEKNATFYAILIAPWATLFFGWLAHILWAV